MYIFSCLILMMMNEYYDFDMSLKGTEMNLSAIHYSPRIISGLSFFILLLRQIYFEIGRLDICIYSTVICLIYSSIHHRQLSTCTYQFQKNYFCFYDCFHDCPFLLIIIIFFFHCKNNMKMRSNSVMKGLFFHSLLLRMTMMMNWWDEHFSWLIMIKTKKIYEE